MDAGSLRQWLLTAVLCMLLGALTGAGFFLLGGIMAPLSDASTVLIGGALVPVTLEVHRRTVATAPSLAARARAIGLSGHVLFALGGFALVVTYLLSRSVSAAVRAGAVAFGVQLLGITLEGVWMFLVGSSFARAPGPRPARGTAYATGVGNLLFVAGTVAGLGGLAGAGGAIGLLGFLAWALTFRASLVRP